MNQDFRPFRPSGTSFRSHRSTTAFRKEEKFSREFQRLSIRLLAVIFFIFFIVSQVFFWQIRHELEVFKHLEIVHNAAHKELAELYAKRDHLMSTPRMAARAAAQLNLHFPEKRQEHNLY